MNNAEVLVKFKGDNKELKTSTEESKKSLTGLSNAVKGAFKATAIGVSATATAISALTKQSVEAYANYEQLTGGIETLFSESEKEIRAYESFYGKTWEELKSAPEGFTTSVSEVLGNADNAYKTAGLSANDYMNTVMSFSASLKQAVKGDSHAMMEYADMAVIDMADNANKMGTDMGMIQSAYQGFAKQNYTMLDNLKLGYGGTKTEMERLIADANEVKKANGEMANLSIDSFADITEAIHIIQTEMGITGTTAKEAEGTISGSLGMVKASYQNLLVAFASGEGIEKAIDNIISSAMTFGENVAPIIENAIDSISKYLPEVANKLIEAIPGLLDKLLPRAVELLSNLVSSIIQILPTVAPMLVNAVVQLVKSIATNQQLIPSIIQGVIMIAQALIDNIGILLDAIFQIAVGIAFALIDAIPILIDKIPEIIDSLVNAITDNLPKIIEMGILLLVKLGIGMIKAIPQIVSKIPQIISSIVSGLGKGLSSMVDIGGNLISGLIKGINGMKDKAVKAVKDVGKNILSGIKNVLGIHSPSKEFAMVGKFSVLGYTEALDDMKDQVDAQIADTFGISPQLQNSSALHYSPNVVVNNEVNVSQDPLGQMVSNIKSYSGGAKNDYNFGMGV